MQFYNPPATGNPAGNPGSYYQPGSIPTGTPGTAPSGTQSAVQGNPFGNIQNSLLGSPQWGTGASFQGAAQQAAIGATEAGMSTQNPQDAQSMNALRQYYQSQLQQMPQQQADNQSMFDTNQQQSLSAALQQNKNAAAGTGLIGSRQFNQQQAATTNNAAQNYMSGLSNLNNNSLQEAGTISAGLQGLDASSLQEQGFDLSQGQNLTNAIAAQQSQVLGLSAMNAQQNQYNQSRAQAVFQGFMKPAASVGSAAAAA